MVDLDSIIIILGMTLIVTTGAVAVFRPLTKRMGDLFDAIILEKRERATLTRNAQLERIVDSQGERIQLLEQRLQFTEGMLDRDRYSNAE